MKIAVAFFSHMGGNCVVTAVAEMCRNRQVNEMFVLLLDVARL